jgi:hypothetical protein
VGEHGEHNRSDRNGSTEIALFDGNLSFVCCLTMCPKIETYVWAKRREKFERKIRQLGSTQEEIGALKNGSTEIENFNWK